MYTKSFRFQEEFYEKLGGLRPELKKMSPLDHARFYLASKYIAGDSLLDIGSYWGDFLVMARSKVTELRGTEINDERCRDVNEFLGEDLVCRDFRHGKLENFQDRSFDTVVCMEVLEHTDDIGKAAREMLRVARKRVIVTVPYKEEHKEYLCIHCNKPTPYMNHLHSFDEKEIKELFGRTDCAEIFVFGTRFFYRLGLPLKVAAALDKIFNFWTKKGKWMFAVIEK
ncbi:MAG: methyltransferase domain-containing protein [Candidatus Omnitrophica bacterium]|nr:methyltransferase domain-containing protein [Candidatus Omnitrophota bacterium]